MTEKDWCSWLSIQQFFIICADLDSKYNNRQYYNGIIEINSHCKDTAHVGVVGKELKVSLLLSGESCDQEVLGSKPVVVVFSFFSPKLE